jgi:3-oxoacyl-[acyl-carrier protein] reductase
MRMKGETALITGSTSGIGKKLAEVFLEEGCNVSICSRNKEKVEVTLGELRKEYEGSVIGFPCDVTDISSLKQTVEATVQTFGSLRILVANAGLNTTYGPLEYLPPEKVVEDAEFVIGVNLIGTINSITVVLPYMKKQRYGRIITLSGAGVSRPQPYMTLYSASKGGVRTFSKCLAEELKEKREDIKINIFLPGMIDTNLGKKTKVISNWKDEEEFKRENSIVLEHIGVDINKSCEKVVPFVLPSCKDNGKEFKGYSVLKLIRGGIKLRGALKKENLFD